MSACDCICLHGVAREWELIPVGGVVRVVEADGSEWFCVKVSENQAWTLTQPDLVLVPAYIPPAPYTDLDAWGARFLARHRRP